ncbi:MAG: hypothetical protein AAFW89_14440 [Bacteroidota bacterium]
MRELETYSLGPVQVTITEGKKPGKIDVTCFDGEFRSSFTVSEYEYKNYKRLMNLRISETFASAKEGD